VTRVEPIRLGLIGCGVIGRQHALRASMSSMVKLVAVADLIEERARDVADKYAVPVLYREGLDLLDDKSVEAVILALPTCGRLVLAMKAFRNGIHVLTEKPVAMNAGDCKKMIAARGALVAVCGQARPRITPAMSRVAGFIRTGALGEIRVINCRAITAPSGPPASPPPTWRLRRAENGGGILMNWGCYDLDYLLGLTGWQLKPRLVLGRTWTVPPAYESYVAPNSDAETHVTALITCEGGEVISYERSEYTAARPEGMWQITGTRGSLHLTLVGGKGTIITIDKATPDHGTVSEQLFPAEDEGWDGMLPQLEDFARAIREKRQPHTGLEEALLVQKITDAIYASSRRGAAVRIKD
jgi:predicted dehydrogenase